MIRLFQVYYPVRTLVLFSGELLIVLASFLIATLIGFGPDAFIVLNYENGLYKILCICLLSGIVSYYLDLYAPERLNSSGETYFRLLSVLGALSFLLAGISWVFPDFALGNNTFLVGLLILGVALFVWRAIYPWLMRQPWLQEKVCVLGSGARAGLLTSAIRTRYDLGIRLAEPEPVGESREQLAEFIDQLKQRKDVKRVIVAVSDRRGKLPTRELLDLRMSGMKIEDAGDLIEQITGKIEVDELHPSALIFAEGFRLAPLSLLVRRVVSTVVSLALLAVVLPLLPIIAIAIKLSSPGSVLFRQLRVGRNGHTFTIYKFRTMRQDAEAKTGATWAGDADPRITRVGRWLRSTRLDEIPQLWNVLKGDMGFVGPRPERPEFVQWLQEAIPYYSMRHIIRPGLTGWAQVRYEYGASLEQAKEKLRYDLYYVKHISLSFDLWILFETVRTVLFGRGAR